MIARGIVMAASGGVLAARLPISRIGERVEITGTHGIVRGTVTALHRDRATIAPHGSLDGVTVGDVVSIDPSAIVPPPGLAALDRTIDDCSAFRATCESIAPANRRAIVQPFWTGVRAIDGLLTLGRGARVGLFGPPGAGKSTLLQSLARGARADAVVVGLVGERGREAEAWMRARPPRTAVVCATGDRSAAERVHAARVALAQAHALRARGLHVLVILDSLARFGNALREVAVAAGESVGRGGYPASVFADLARLVEIAGTTAHGSITLIATVLSDGDERDPISDAARSLLDGHIELAAARAQAGRFPAIDVPGSASRTALDVIDAGHARHARAVRGAIAALAQTADARSLGMVPADPFAARAVMMEEAIEGFLCQGGEPSPVAATRAELARLADNLLSTAWISPPI
ncbi:MAG TPA: ATP-binding cassette domain-containing protein [Candidatus Baltobacteraceae bacterium]